MINLRKFLLLAGDIFLLYLSLILALFFGFWPDLNLKIFFSHLLPFSILYLFWLIIFYIFGLYDLNVIKTKFTLYPRIFTALFVGILAGVILFYLVPVFGISPKTNLVLNALISGVLIFSWRKLFYYLFSFYFLNKVAIIGESSKTKELSQEILNRPYLGYKLIPIDQNQDLLSQIQKENLDLLIVAEDLSCRPDLLQNLYNLLPARINFLSLPQAYEIVCQKIPVDSISQSWFLENLREGEKGVYDKLKRIFDIFLASFIFLATLPLWPFIILAIKLEDRGPIFYFQKRVGKDRKPFWLIKFRSMRPDAEKEGPVWAEKEDPRVTKVGKILRRFHLDEIPQMINVLRGDISLVGPRPERPEFVAQLEKEIPHYHLRHLIKPGFTGWAQIKFRYGRSIMDSFEKFQYDLYYLKNRSLFLDLKILLKTFQLFFKKE